jgi:hypothetical protein
MKVNSIKIGILIDDLYQPYWVFQVLNNILEDSSFELSILIVKKKTKMKKINLNQLIFLPYWILKFVDRIIFEIFFKKNINVNLFDRMDLKKLFKLKHVPILFCNVIESKYSDEFIKSDIEKIQYYNCDLLLRFGFRILKGEILNCSKLGVWSLHHGDNINYRGGPAAFWEFINLDSKTSAILQKLGTQLDGGLVLDKVSIQTNPINYYFSCQTLYATATGMLLNNLDNLKQIGIENYLKLINRRQAESNIDIYSSVIYRRPSFFIGLFLLVKYLFRSIINFLNTIFYKEQWCLYFKFGNYENEVKVNLKNFQKITPPNYKYWADPFFVELDNIVYIFVEEYIYSQKKGTIALIEIDKTSKKWNYKGIVLSEDFHLSFPNVFNYNGTFYMIPECQNSNQVRLYKAINFPFEWILERVLIDDVSAVDPIFYKDNNTFFLFINKSSFINSSASSNLCLYFSNDLLTGKFIKYENNPISSDIKISRNAGNIFKIGNKIYRPSQDCSHRYGYAINLNEICDLTSKTYKEKKVLSILPKWEKDIIGTHTFNISNNFMIIDVNKKKRRFLNY